MPIAGMPWETGSTEGKYRYHPGGNPQAEPKDAPSAVNVVIVPDVTLPKVRMARRLVPTLGWEARGVAKEIQRLTQRIAPSRQVQQMGQGWLLD